MKRQISILLLIMLFSQVLIAQSGRICKMDTVPVVQMTLLKSMKDKQGNTYEGGYYFHSYGGYYTGSNNFIIRKLDPNRNLLWEKKMVPHSDSKYIASYCSAFDIDEDGNVYAGGDVCANYLKFDSLIISIDYNAKSKAFLVKLDSLGNRKWIIYSSQGTTRNAGVTSVLVNGNNIMFSAITQPGFVYADSSIVNSGGIAVVTIDKNGLFVSQKSPYSYAPYGPVGMYSPAGSSISGKAYGIYPKLKKLKNDRILMFGYAYKKLTFGNMQVTPFSSTSYGTCYTGYVAILNEFNQWDTVFTTHSTNSFYLYTSVDVDKDDNIYISQYSQNLNSYPVHFQINGGPSISNHNLSAVIKFNTQGQFLWHNEINNLQIEDISCGKSDEIIAIGTYKDSVTIQSQSLADQYLPSTPNTSIAFLKYTTNGDLAWYDHLTGSDDLELKNTYVDACEKVHILSNGYGVFSVDNFTLINNFQKTMELKYQNNADCICNSHSYLEIDSVNAHYSNCQPSVVQISWASMNIQHVDIDYSTDGGSTFLPLIHNYPGSANHYAWQVPILNANKMLFRIQSSADSSMQNSSEILLKRMNGTYTVGGINPDYSNLNEIVKDINRYGICGNTTVLIRDGIYSGIRLSKYHGNNTYSLNFIGESLDSTKVRLYAFNFDNKNYNLYIEGGKNISFEHISFTDTLGSNANISILPCVDNQSQFAHNISFQSCIVQLQYGSEFLYKGNHLLLKNCSFTYLNSNYPSSCRISGDENFPDQSYHHRITKCTFDNVKLELYRIGKAKVYDNEFTTYGIFVQNHFDSTYIYNNRFNGRAVYVDSDYPSAVYFYNNFCITTAANDNNSFIASIRNGKTYIAHNSIVCSKGKGFSVTTTKDTTEIKNNIINITSGKELIQSYTNCNLDINYNAFSLFNNSILGLVNNQQYAGLPQWQGLGYDLNSFIAPSSFVSSTDLHCTSSAMDNTGIPLPFVSYDIDNEVRSPFTPDIGADEFTATAFFDINFAPVDIILSPNPTSNSFSISASNAHIQRVRILNSTLGCIKSEDYNGSKSTVVTMDMSSFSKGVYFVNIYTDKGIETKKLIKI